MDGGGDESFTIASPDYIPVPKFWIWLFCYAILHNMYFGIYFQIIGKILKPKIENEQNNWNNC